MNIRNAFIILSVTILLIIVGGGDFVQSVIAQNEEAFSTKLITTEAELVERLEQAVAKGGYDEGLAMLKTTVEREPLNLPARFFLATAYQTGGNYSQCIQEARTAEQLKTIDDRLLGILWVCLYESGQKSEALKTSGQAVNQFPESGESHRWHGISLLDEKKLDEASVHFQKAITINPHDDTSLYMLAQTYRLRGYIVPSFLTYLRFLAVEPEGNRAQKARTQFKTLVDSKLFIEFKSETDFVAGLTVGTDGPIDEGDFSEAQKMIAVFAAPNNREPNLTSSKLQKTIEEVLKELPDKNSVPKGSFILQEIAPYLLAARNAKMIKGLAELVVMEDEPTPDAISFFKWSENYNWSKK